MATPRKHWFKVADSIGDEDWDNDVLATLIRLQARLNTKWARNGLTGEEAGQITLTAGDAMAVTRRSSFARASLLLRRCTRAASIVLHEQSASVKISWPKWPEFQGIVSRESPESRPLRKTPPQDARRKTQEEEKRAPSAPPAPRSCVCPDRLSDHAMGLMLDWSSPRGLTIDQVEYAWERVRDWSRSKQLKRTDWAATLRNAIAKGWALEGYGAPPPGSPIQNNRESAAQARERRNNEAAAEAFRQMTGAGDPPPLLALPGGRS